MSGGGWGLVIAVVLGLAISEFSELSPWLAHKLIRWAARVRYPTRVEELSALIAERPGKLFKLVTASGFACAALTYRVTHRKTVPVHSLTSRFWIGLASALVAGMLLAGELLLTSVIASVMVSLLELIILGSIAAFVTVAELLLSTRLPAGWAIAVVSVVLFSIAARVLVAGWNPRVGDLLPMGGMAVAAGVSGACTIRLGNRLRFPVMAASSTILGGSLLNYAFIWRSITEANRLVMAALLSESISLPVNFLNYAFIWTSITGVNGLVELLGLGFAFGFSAGVGVLLWRVLCDRWLSQSPPERMPRTAT